MKLFFGPAQSLRADPFLLNAFVGLIHECLNVFVACIGREDGFGIKKSGIMGLGIFGIGIHGKAMIDKNLVKEAGFAAT